MKNGNPYITNSITMMKSIVISILLTLFFQSTFSQNNCYEICKNGINLRHLKNRINCITNQGFITIDSIDSTFQFEYYHKVGVHLYENYYTLKGTIIKYSRKENLLFIDSVLFNKYYQTGLSSTVNETPQKLSIRKNTFLKCRVHRNYIRIKGVKIYSSGKSLKSVFFSIG